MAMSVCVCFYECLYPLPPQYHLKGKKVYNLSSNLVSERFHLSLGNINSFMSMFRESLWLGKGRGFSRVACSNPFSTALLLAPWSPLSPAAWLWASQPHWEPHPRSVPFPVAALASPACASAGRQKSDPCEAGRLPWHSPYLPATQTRAEVTGTISSFVILL